MRISNAAAIVALDALTLLLNTGGAGSIKVYTGAQPATVETTATGTLLGTLGLSTDAFGDATDGTNKAVATANSITSDTNADAAGTAGWFRALNGSGTAIIDGDITASAGGGDLELADITIEAGGTIAATAWTITLPEA